MSRHPIPATLLALCLALPAAGQTAFFERDFASGLKAVQDAARKTRIEALQQPPDGDVALLEAADGLARRITADPQDLESLFRLQGMTLERMRAILIDIHAKHGTVVKTELASLEGPRAGWFRLETEKGHVLRVFLMVSDARPVRIVGIRFTGAAMHRSIAEAVEDLKKPPGTVSFKLVKLGRREETLHALNADSTLGIGSTFKLYLLALLAEDGGWDGVLRLKEELRSHPSGDMRKWPAGSPVTLHTLAALMISESDNTATDHVLAHLGRERVEGAMARLGNAQPGKSAPFLSTAEMFKLKENPAVLKRYLKADTSGRRALLEGEVRRLPLGDPGSFPTTPVAIDSVEWFASASDLCRLMSHFDAKDDKTALDIIAINPGLDFPGEVYGYVGYKGGSEPGVLNLTWLIRTKEGERYALSAGWNDPAGPLDEDRFIAILQSVIYLLPDSR